MPSAPGNGIKVYLRVRPTKRPSGFFQFDAEEPNRVDVDIPHEVALTHSNNAKTAYKFKFNGIIHQDAKQDEVFDRVAKVSAKPKQR